MKHTHKCENIHEKLAILEYLKKGGIAFQETAWILRDKDFDKYPYIYFDDHYGHIGCTHENNDNNLISAARLFEIAFNSGHGKDLKLINLDS